MRTGFLFLCKLKLTIGVYLYINKTVKFIFLLYETGYDVELVEIDTEAGL